MRNTDDMYAHCVKKAVCDYAVLKEAYRLHFPNEPLMPFSRYLYVSLAYANLI